jgi:adenylosuccinate lyase
MIPRYSLPEMAAIVDDTARFGRWLEIELLATEAWATLGVVPPDDAAMCRARAPTADAAFVATVEERERATDHDVAAFVDVVQAAIGPPAGKWIHYGLTSSDVVDTALCWMLRDAVDLLLGAADDLIGVLRRLAEAHRDTPMVGRTHGIHAEPTTFGAKVALWCLQVDRDRSRLRAAREIIAVGKLSGAVGTYSNVEPAVEAFVCERLGLVAVPATQVVGRDRHAEVLYGCAALGTTIELIAVELRHLQRTEVREVQEGFTAGQKGSSAMPHKRNPITAERLSGLARVLRGYLVSGLEDVALWHERDISHSSVERVILPDSFIALDHMLRRFTKIVSGMVVYPDRMLENLRRSRGVVFSGSILLELARRGVSREQAYEWVQRSAMKSHENGQDFKTLLQADAEVTRVLPAAAIEETFDLGAQLRHADTIFDRVFGRT